MIFKEKDEISELKFTFALSLKFFREKLSAWLFEERHSGLECLKYYPMPVTVSNLDLVHSFTETLEGLNQGSIWLNEDGHIVAINNAFARCIGYKDAEECRFKTIFEVDPYTNLITWRKNWNELLEKKQILLVTEHITSKGMVLPLKIKGFLLQNGDWQFCCGVILNNNLLKEESKEKVSEEKNSENEETLKLTLHTFNQLGEAVYWVLPDGSLKFFNDAFCKLTGYSRREVGKMKLLDFYPDYTEEDFMDGWKKLKSRETVKAELLITGKDGTKQPVEITTSLAKYMGEDCACGILRNIRNRKVKEKELMDAYEEIKDLKEKLEMDNTMLKEEIELNFNFNTIISKSSNYKRVLKQVERVADTDATVLILGETGTGKELLARAIHQLSNRADRAMIKVNCGALPENLIESELFGHEKGAFTGAFQTKKGRFELADNGTIFLDEIGELPLDLQTKLLRVLQEGEFERVGGTQTISVDVRVITATNRNLEKQVQDGRFREDLYYRLNVFPIYNIPLRERKEDIPLLISHFVEKFSKRTGRKIQEIPQHILNRLLDYEFPGNVRELENLVERAVILSPGSTLKMDLSFLKTSNSHAKNATFLSIEEAQKQHIFDALRRTKGRVSGESGAAALLKINDKTLISRMKKLGIKKTDYLSER